MSDNKKRRNVFLFGAGAVLDWKAPSTNDLTDLVRKNGFCLKGSNTRITEFIYHQLKEVGKFEEKDINFETIINVIEELIVYYSSFNVQNKTPSLLSLFLMSKFEDELLNFTRVLDVNGSILKIEIPGVSSKFARETKSDKQTPEQFFFQQLLADILSVITEEVLRYACYLGVTSEVISDQNKEQNQLFANWVKKVNGDDILRIYTLNYDRNFKIILDNLAAPISIFDGFTCDKELDYNKEYLADVNKILSDKDSNIHYNLHGSVFWELEDFILNEYPNPIFKLKAGPSYPFNSYEHTIWQSEKGKTIMLTNIITGYQKTQRGIFSPFKQMQASFDYDCCFADTIYIVGYSFSDEHINSSIKTAIQYNEHVKIVIVDPEFTQDENDVNIGMKILSCAENRVSFNVETIQQNVHSFYNGKFIVHNKKFEEYMCS